MKRIALIFTLIGLLFAACSPAPEDPAPLPGVIDLTAFSGEFDEAYLRFMCVSDDLEADVTVRVFGLETELDLDDYRPDCAGPVFTNYPPQQLIDAGFGKITGTRLLQIFFDSEIDWIFPWPEGLDGATVRAVFYANEGGVIDHTSSHPVGIGSISTLIMPSTEHFTAKFSYSPGWNALLRTSEVVGSDIYTELNIVPLHTLAWDEYGGTSSSW